MPGNLPQRLPLEQMQVRWANLIQPVLDSPTATPVLLKGLSLSAGTNTIDHRLGRPLVGWIPCRMRNAFSELYDVQDANPLPERTLLLVSSVDCVVDLLVF